MLNIQALQSAQRALEQESIALGVEKYRAALAAGEDTMPPGMRLIKAAIAPLSAAITEHQEKAHNGMPGRDAGEVTTFRVLERFWKERQEEAKAGRRDRAVRTILDVTDTDTTETKGEQAE